MLGTLLKHEFRATGRLMLPALGAMLVMSLLGNLAMRFIGQVEHPFPLMVLAMIISVAVLALFAAWIMAFVLMIRRFRTNLLGDEGYLMFTLPVTVHDLIWSKLLTALCWIVLTGLLVSLVLFGTIFHLAGTQLGEILRELPSWEQVWDGLAELGISRGQVYLVIAQYLLGLLVSVMANCLLFYAALAVGHSFAKDKILLSVVFYLVISFGLSLLGSAFGVSLVLRAENVTQFADATGAFSWMSQINTQTLLLALIQGAVLYLLTALVLKRRLNLG